VSDRDATAFETGPVNLVAFPTSVETIAGAAFDEYAGRMKAYAYAATRDAAVAEDVVQEAFLRLVHELRAAREPDNIAAWLFRVSSNLVASRGRHRTVVERAKNLLVDRGAGRSAEETVVAREQDRNVVRALHGLPAAARIALLMAGSGMSSGEIATEVGKSVGATRTLLCRARLQLREALAQIEEGPR
jgi:RNA polymerase sigma-70 factor (ECF subfamily)